MARRRLAGSAFAALLLLSLWWPTPIVSINHLCCDAHLGVDELSFLGRESPRWDLVFWCLTGLLGIGLFHSGQWERSEFVAAWRLRLPRLHPAPLIIASACSAAVVAATWLFFDAPITAWAEQIQSDTVENIVRITNRLGGGMNPALIVLFFLLAGLLYRDREWSGYGVRMAIAGAAAGVAVQIVKYAAGRTRPELWLGPFHHARISATSFPSGHTVGAFAIAGVLIFQSKSAWMRVFAVLLATAVGISRMLVFRHWTSDVVASACIGLILAWVVTRVTSPPEIVG